MKAIGIITTAALTLVLGVAAPLYAQEQHDEHNDKQEQKDQPAKQEQKQAQPEEKKAQPEKSAHPEKQQAQQKESNQQEKQQAGQEKANQHAQQPQKQNDTKQEHAQQQKDNKQPQRTQEQQHVQQAAWQQHRAKNWQSDHRTWQQRGGYHGYRIPDDRFHGYFGPDHGFRIDGLPFLVVGGYPRFQYEGYWFSPVNPWPESWAVNWYDTDDVYVTYVDNGYYLYNRRYPTVGIAISISL